MKALSLLLLALCACAGPPRTYRQGAPMAPAFSPMEDAPHTLGQPGYVEPSGIPRSPYIRVLPPTKEPGLWASSAPRTVPAVRLIGEVLALDTDPQEDTAPAISCALRAQAVFETDEALAERVLSISSEARGCLAALVLLECLAFDHAVQKEDMRKREQGGEIMLRKDTARETALRVLADRASRHVTRLCSDDVLGAATRAAHEWSASFHHPRSVGGRQ